MKKTLLPILLLLALTACNERNSLAIPSSDIPQPTAVKSSEQNHIDPISSPSLPLDTPVVETKVEPAVKPEIKSNVEPKVEPEVKPTIKKKVEPKVQTNTKSNIETFGGGTMTDGLDMGIIRLGKEGHTTRLVFDSFKWNSGTRTPSVRSHDSGSYTFRYNPQNRRITAIVNGYRSFSALQMGKARLFGSDEMVKKIYLEKYLDDSAYKFTIELKKNAKVNVFELKGPGRIIVDISPL